MILLTPFVTVSAGVDNRLGGVTRHVGWIDGKQSRGSAPPVLSIFKKGDEVVVDSLAEALEQEHQEIDGGIELFLADPSSDGAQPEQLLRVIAALRRHIYLEEEFVFPRLKAAGTFAAVLVMLREHGEIWRTLDSMESELTADDDAAAAAEVGRTLLTQLEVHNEKEEPIIYSQMDAAITDGPADELRAFLAIGTIPEGWTCAQAGRA